MVPIEQQRCSMTVCLGVVRVSSAADTGNRAMHESKVPYIEQDANWMPATDGVAILLKVSSEAFRVTLHIQEHDIGTTTTHTLMQAHLAPDAGTEPYLLNDVHSNIV